MAGIGDLIRTIGSRITVITDYSRSSIFYLVRNLNQ